ncbi:HAD family phosphatase [Candidatus Nomurabacteria bacterium]|nr:HAD family phosphatase [Candidatus Nomurabacteria bacterium]
MLNSAIRNKIRSAKYFFFDFDGTLVNLEKLNLEGFTKVFKNHTGKDLSIDEYKNKLAGKKSVDGFSLLIEEFGMTGVSPAGLVAEFRKIKRNAIQKDPGRFSDLVSGADKFVSWIVDEGKICAITSSSSKEFIDALLSYYGILQYFDRIWDYTSPGLGKPSPDIYFTAMNYYRASTNECMIFEDSKNGLSAGRSSGIFTVGIKNSPWNDGYVDDMADAVIEGYEEVMEND